MPPKSNHIPKPQLSGRPQPPSVEGTCITVKDVWGPYDAKDKEGKYTDKCFVQVVFGNLNFDNDGVEETYCIGTDNHEKVRFICSIPAEYDTWLSYIDRNPKPGTDKPGARRRWEEEEEEMHKLFADIVSRFSEI